VNQNEFWRPQPKEPWADWRTYSMLVPIGISMLGFFVSGIFAFAFSDIDVIVPTVQSWMVIVSSGLIVLGAEANTPGTVIEVFRKLLRKEHNGWDISALVLSLVGTIVNLLVTFASRTKLDPVWRSALLNWGPLVSGFAVACDYYGGLLETGFLFGSFELRMDAWLEQRQAHNERHGIKHKDPLPAARIEQYRVVVARHNGNGPLNAEQLESELHADGYGLPSPSTVGRWLKMGAQ
jgi:uncharacterized membrane protein YidH (DUF202 family)